MRSAFVSGLNACLVALVLSGCASSPKKETPSAASEPRPNARMEPTKAANLLVISAVYGSGAKFADVTHRVNDLLRDPEAYFWAKPKWLGADPTPGWNKALVIVYELDGRRRLFTTGEGGTVSVGRLLKNAEAGAAAAERKTGKPAKKKTKKAERPVADASVGRWGLLSPMGDVTATGAVVVWMHAPEGLPTVEVVGTNHFARTGYVEWRAGLRVDDVEAAAGYTGEGGLPVEVRIMRGGREIYRGQGPWGASYADGSFIGQPRPKVDAPSLEPGDQVVAGVAQG